MMGFWLLMLAAASVAFPPIKVYEGTWMAVSARAAVVDSVSLGLRC
jgi:hypothetical protein